MIILRNRKEVQNLITDLKSDNKSIGFVPTMGALHTGHISLVEAAKSENDFIIVSIFVNPTQFNNSDDLKKYPRTEEQDISLLKESKVNAIYLPDVKDIYPNGQISQHFEFGGLENQMEGKFRPGHFDGVGTVVKTFFEIVKPNRAYFGEKDFQQLQIIRKMVELEKIPLQIIPVAIKREKDGLAMSSRNLRLTPKMRKESVKINKIMKSAKSYFKTHSPAETKKFVKQEFQKTGIKLEYVEIADEKTLRSVRVKKENRKIRMFIAAFADDIRLIDNMSLN